jgi:hypothetical protein
LVTLASRKLWRAPSFKPQLDVPDSVMFPEFSSLVVLDEQVNVLASISLVEWKKGDLRVSDELWERWKETLQKFDAVFYIDGRKLPASPLIKHRIELMPGCKPKFVQNYQPSHADKEKVQEIVNKMLKEDWIEPSDAQVNSPFILVQKPDGDIRFCLDFRALNSITVPDRWWPIRVDQILESLSGCSWFSKLDMKNGFYQVMIEESDRYLTSFTVPDGGQWRYKRMPFGLMNAPATFCSTAG